jgi:hypothetical protein
VFWLDGVFDDGMDWRARLGVGTDLRWGKGGIC